MVAAVKNGNYYIGLCKHSSYHLSNMTLLEIIMIQKKKKRTEKRNQCTSEQKFLLSLFTQK